MTPEIYTIYEREREESEWVEMAVGWSYEDENIELASSTHKLHKILTRDDYPFDLLIILLPL